MNALGRLSLLLTLGALRRRLIVQVQRGDWNAVEWLRYYSWFFHVWENQMVEGGDAESS